MARSDPNSPEASVKMHDMDKARHSSGSGLEEEDRTIHSGQFMLSRVHDGDSETDDDSLGFTNDNRGFDFLEAQKFTSRTYEFGPRSTQTLAIDASLTKLFQCMTLAYSGKITSPKWKPFKGMPLSLKDKVRLNNIIWREWPMQYIYCRRPVVCQFATPVSDEVHTKPEAVVLEGKYWKRRLDTVTAEYKKWRKYYKERVLMNPPELNITELSSHNDLLERVREVNQVFTRQPSHQTDPNLLSEEEFIMDFSDTLFSTLNQPFAFPNPRELSQSGYADIIQPGLMQLQPNLDDLCMDTFDPIQDMLSMRGSQSFGPPVNAVSNRNNFNQLDNGGFIGQGDANVNTLGFQMDLFNTLGNAAHGSQQQQQQTQALLQAALTSFASQFQQSNNNFSSPQFNHNSMDVSPQSVIPDTHMVVDPPSTPPQYSPLPPQTQSIPALNDRKTPISGHNKGNNSILKSPTILTTQQQQGKPRQPQHIQSKNFTQPQQIKGPSSSKRTPLHVGPKAVSNQGKPMSYGVYDKKEVSFAVPKPVGLRSKQRPIAPAPALPGSPGAPTPSSNVVQKNTYLAQLLTTGNYPGAVIKVKNEPTRALPCVNDSNVLPQFRPVSSPQHTVQTTQACQPIAPATPGIAIVTNVGDFQASVLIAAASQALGTSTVSVKDVVSIAHTTQLASKTTIPTSSPSQTPSLFSTSPIPSSPATFTNIGSPASIGSPSDFSMPVSPSTTGVTLYPKQENTRGYREDRKLSHISAEQKRRCNIKSGFDVIHVLIPSLSQNPNAKVSKAAMLQKTAEYCKKLKSERTQMQNESAILKQEIESLNSDINMCQLQLPATGVPITRQRADKMRELFEDYVKSRTLLNWKFWIFSSIIRTLFESYNSMVSTVSLDELCRSVLAWLDQHCSLVSLRPTVLNSLRHLSTTTSILSDPSQVPEQVTRAVTKQNSKDASGDTS